MINYDSKNRENKKVEKATTGSKQLSKSRWVLDGISPFIPIFAILSPTPIFHSDVTAIDNKTSTDLQRHHDVISDFIFHFFRVCVALFVCFCSVFSFFSFVLLFVCFVSVCVLLCLFVSIPFCLSFFFCFIVSLFVLVCVALFVSV